MDNLAQNSPTCSSISVRIPFDDLKLDESELDDQIEESTWTRKRIVITVLLIALSLWILNILVTLFGLKKVASKFPESLNVQLLEINAADTNEISIRAHVEIESSIWFYTFQASLYKQTIIEIGFPDWDISNLISIHVPPIELGRSNRSVKFIDEPVKIKLDEKTSVSQVLNDIRKSTREFTQLDKLKLNARISVKLSFFSMSLWIPIWLDRTIAKDFTIPLFSSESNGEKKKGLKACKKTKERAKKNLIEVSSIEMPEADKQLKLVTRLNVNFDSFPVRLPLKLFIPNLSIILGAGLPLPRALLVISIEKQVISCQSSELLINVEVPSTNIESLAKASQLASHLNQSTRVLLQGEPLENNALQKFISKLDIDLSVEEILKMEKNLSKSMNKQSKKFKGKNEELDFDHILKAPEIFEADIQSISSNGHQGALIKGQFSVLKDGVRKLSPLIDTFKGSLPSLGFELDDPEQTQFLRLFFEFASNSSSSLTINISADINNPDTLIKALLLFRAYRKGFPPSVVPMEAHNLTKVTLKPVSTNPIIQTIFNSLLIDLHLYGSHGQISFQGSPQFDLLPRNLEKVKAAPGTRPNVAHIETARHLVDVQIKETESTLEGQVRVDLQSKPVSEAPQIKVMWPRTSLEFSGSKTLIGNVQLQSGSAKLSIEKRPALLPSLIHSGSVNAKITIGGSSSNHSLFEVILENVEKILMLDQFGALHVTGGSGEVEPFSFPIPLPSKILVLPVVATEIRPKIMKSGIHALQSGFLTIGAVSGPNVLGMFGFNKTACPIDPSYIISVNLSLVRINAALKLHKSDKNLVAVTIPRLHMNVNLADKDICGITITDFGDGSEPFSHITEYYNQRVEQIVPIVLKVGELNELLELIRKPERISTITTSGIDQKFVGKFLDDIGEHFDLQQYLSERPPKRSSSSSIQYSGLGEVKVSTMITSPDNNSFDLDLKVQLPLNKSPNEAIPTPKLMIGPALLALKLSDFISISLQVSKIALPIKVHPRASSLDYTYDFSIKLSIHCQKPMFSRDIQSAISDFIKEPTDLPLSIQLALPDGKSFQSVYDVKSSKAKFPVEILDSIRYIDLGKVKDQAENSNSSSGNNQSKDPMITLGLKPVPGTLIGTLPCPFAEICAQTSASRPLNALRISTSVQKVLPAIGKTLSSLMPTISRVLAIQAPHQIAISICLENSVESKVSVNNVLIGGARLQPFRAHIEAIVSPFLYKEGDINMDIDLSLNPGTRELQQIFEPVTIFPLRSVDPFPSFVVHFDDDHDDNLLSSIVSGCLMTINVKNLLSQSEKTKTHEENSALLYKSESVSDHEVVLNVQGLPKISLPFHLINQKLNLVLNYQQVDIISIQVDIQGNQVSKASVHLTNGHYFGQIIGNVISGKPFPINAYVQVDNKALVQTTLQIPKQSYLSHLIHRAIHTHPSDKSPSDKSELEKALPIPKLPFIIDPLTTLIEKVTLALSTSSLLHDEELFRIDTVFAICEDFLSTYKVGIDLIGAYLPLRKAGVIFVGSDPCVPSLTNEMDLKSFSNCIASHPFPLILDDRLEYSESSENEGIDTDELKKATKTAETLSKVSNIPQIKSAINLFAGNQMEEKARVMKRLAMATPFKTIAMIVDGAMSRNGVCLDIGDQGYIDLAIRGEGTFPIHIPLTTKLPIPLDPLSDPCQIMNVPSCTSTLLPVNTIPEKHADNEYWWIPEAIDTMMNWDLDFVLSTPSASPKASAFSVLLYRAPHENAESWGNEPKEPVISISFAPLRQSTSIFQSILSTLPIQIPSDPSNIIYMSLNGQILNARNGAATEKAGAFPPKASRIHVKVSHTSTHIHLQCTDADHVDPHTYSTTFALHIRDLLEQPEKLSIGFGGHPHGFHPSKVHLSQRKFMPENAKVFCNDFVRVERPASFLLQLVDECGQSQARKDLNVRVRLVMDEEIISCNVTFLSEKLVFKVDFTPKLAGLYSVQVITDEKWTSIKDGSIMVASFW